MTVLDKKTLPALLINNALFNFSRTLPGAIIVVVILAHGVSLQAFTLAKALQLITSAIVTIPAGMVADRYGRKKALIIACLCQIMYFSLLIEPTSNKVILGEIFNGMGLAFYAGSYEAWLLHLNSKRHDYRFMNNIIRSSEMVFLSIATASIIGALISTYVFIITVICLILVTLFYYILPEEKAGAPENKEKPLPSHMIFVSAFRYLLVSNIGKVLLISGVVSIGMMQFIYQYWQPFFVHTGLVQPLVLALIFFIYFMWTISIFHTISQIYLYKTTINPLHCA